MEDHQVGLPIAVYVGDSHTSALILEAERAGYHLHNRNQRHTHRGGGGIIGVVQICEVVGTIQRVIPQGGATGLQE